ncbi:MAG: AAA family ATPase, partial [Nitrosopumilaceae archaeon]
MKINSIKISNILSFEHKDTIDDCQEIRFDKNLNILIGPNGAGKSNFLEIINKIFKMGIVWGCTYDRNTLEMFKKDPPNYRQNNAIRRQTPVHNLSNNYFSDYNDMKIKIECELNENDFSNLIFIQKNAEEINQLLLKYAGVTVNFNSSVSEAELRTKSSMVFEIESQADNKIFTNKTGINDEPSRFILNYFVYFEYLQNLMKIVNEYENKDWPPLKNTFALIGGYRNFNQIDPLFKLDPNESSKWEELRSKVTLDGTRESKNEEPVVFVYVKHKLSYKLNHIEHQIIQGLMSNETKNTAMDFLRKDPLFKNINDLLEANLNLTLDIEHKEKTLDYYFNFKNKSTNRPVQISDLSSGEKGIIHFIFSIYGYELKD